ncbi:phosphotriesterase family protein [Flexivirga meconopsidis]|uniref:phosphotriesterase family protein n=1 Tax=Flexivirga meconopsidis TaxID=2977121 RepID=UPI00223ED36E|nr:phosphotriesterase-related protein [Flexivirga meconopsidis]
MATVQTVRGPVDVDALGQTLMHEHVFVLNEEYRLNYPDHWDEETRVRDAIDRLRALKAVGVDTIVDPTVLGLGRDIRRILRVNAEVDLNIIPATGLYTYNELPFVFSLTGPGTMLGGDEPMTPLFVRDLTEGIADTGVKAAFLKCAVEEQGVTPGVLRVLHAVADAHRQTGAPITVHTNAIHHRGLEVQEIFREQGVDLAKVVIGHSGDSTDLDYLQRLIDGGSYVGMDRFGLNILLPFEDRVRTVARLVERGLAERIVLAQDASCYIDWFPPGMPQQLQPQWKYTHIHDDVLPALREQGVTEEQIDTMLVTNPRTYFTPDAV